MLPTATDNGGRLAAILPTGLLALASSLDHTSENALRAGLGSLSGVNEELLQQVLHGLPKIHSLVVVVVDGLGSANLKARAGHAPTLSALPQRRITTVTPSTTAAAITSLTTGVLPGEHGHVGYKIRHPELGVITSLRDWEHIPNVRQWQLAHPLFELATESGIRSLAFGRPVHADSGFTRAVLTGTTYIGGKSIADRFSAARDELDGSAPTLAYVYVDELDRIGHSDGWQSSGWSARLEQFDAALADFLTGLPIGVGVVVTADHGMVDIARHQQVVFDRAAPELADVVAVGGEPRFRSFYLRDGADPHRFASWLEQTEGKRAWVATRDQAFSAGFFGKTVSAGVTDRVGDVLLAARGQCAYYFSDDDTKSFDMVGQHGSWTDEEQGIPLVLGGALAGTGFARAVGTLAAGRDSVA